MLMWFNGCFPNLPCPLPRLPGLWSPQPTSCGTRGKAVPRPLPASQGCPHWPGLVARAAGDKATRRSPCHLQTWPWERHHASSNHGHGNVTMSALTMAMGRPPCHLLAVPWEGPCAISNHCRDASW